MREHNSTVIFNTQLKSLYILLQLILKHCEYYYAGIDFSLCHCRRMDSKPSLLVVSEVVGSPNPTLKGEHVLTKPSINYFPPPGKWLTLDSGKINACTVGFCKIPRYPWVDHFQPSKCIGRFANGPLSKKVLWLVIETELLHSIIYHWIDWLANPPTPVSQVLWTMGCWGWLHFCLATRSINKPQRRQILQKNTQQGMKPLIGEI
mgnify:FL=1